MLPKYAQHNVKQLHGRATEKNKQTSKQNKTNKKKDKTKKQNKTEQNETKQNKTKQNKKPLRFARQDLNGPPLTT